MRHSYPAAVAAFMVIALALAEPAYSGEPLASCTGSTGESITWYPDQMELDVHRPNIAGQAPGLNLPKCADASSSSEGPIVIPGDTPPLGVSPLWETCPNYGELPDYYQRFMSNIHHAVEPPKSGGDLRSWCMSIVGFIGQPPAYSCSMESVYAWMRWEPQNGQSPTTGTHGEWSLLMIMSWAHDLAEYGYAQMDYEYLMKAQTGTLAYYTGDEAFEEEVRAAWEGSVDGSVAAPTRAFKPGYDFQGKARDLAPQVVNKFTEDFCEGR